MRKLLIVLLVVHAVLLSMRIWQEAAKVARAGAPVVHSSENGDLNGDNRRDVSDAIYLLEWLFHGGPEPVALAQEVGALTPEQQEVLSHLRVVDIEDGEGARLRTVQLSGANFQIVNGAGATATANGLGNLIVGYHEERTGPGAVTRRGGSHNVILGIGNNYSSWGGVVGGGDNELTGAYSAAFGIRNTVSGDGSFIAAGADGEASGVGCFVGGGSENHASGQFASVSGGLQNRAEGTMSSIAGGFANVTRGVWTVVSGGHQNVAVGLASSVTGGWLNVAEGRKSTVSGGLSNRTRDPEPLKDGGLGGEPGGAVVSGGTENLAEHSAATVSGGRGRVARVALQGVAGALSQAEERRRERSASVSTAA